MFFNPFTSRNYFKVSGISSDSTRDFRSNMMHFTTSNNFAFNLFREDGFFLVPYRYRFVRVAGVYVSFTSTVFRRVSSRFNEGIGVFVPRWSHISVVLAR